MHSSIAITFNRTTCVFSPSCSECLQTVTTTKKQTYVRKQPNGLQKFSTEESTGQWNTKIVAPVLKKKRKWNTRLVYLIYHSPTCCRSLFEIYIKLLYNFLLTRTDCEIISEFFCKIYALLCCRAMRALTQHTDCHVSVWRAILKSLVSLPAYGT